MDGKIRLGIVGTGRIAHRMFETCKDFTESVDIRVYNPNWESASCFGEEYGLDRELAYSDIEEFDKDTDAVYIATPHETHYDYVKDFLTRGKHVLCEKPLCFSGQQARELYELARDKGCILMEAVKTAYCPGFIGLMKLINDGVIGDVVDVESTFTRLNNSNVREIWDMDNGGSFVEFGTYTLLPIVKILGTESRESHIWSLPTVTGVDSYAKFFISYGRACATAKTGLGVKSEGQLLISGSNGYILLPSPWWMTRRIEVHHEDASKVEIYDFPWDGSGLQYELSVFINRIPILKDAFFDKKTNNELEERTVDVWKSPENDGGLTADESIWLAEQMEYFRANMGPELREAKAELNFSKPKVWAHRGCSMKYPENTLAAFEAAAKLSGITGIELDIQLSKDGEIVVIHDETLDRTTNGKGNVRDYTLEELKSLAITGSGSDKVYLTDRGNTSDTLTIPTMKEVLELLKPYCVNNGLMINIELKNGVVRYEGMEEKILKLVEEIGLKDYVVYSSFNHESMGYMKELDPSVKTGILAVNIQDCIRGAEKYNADALHPSVAGLLVNRMSDEYFPDERLRKERMADRADKASTAMIVRAWGGNEPFYGQKKKLVEREMDRYTALGVTDIITNVPERYL